MVTVEVLLAVRHWRSYDCSNGAVGGGGGGGVHEGRWGDFSFLF